MSPTIVGPTVPLVFVLVVAGLVRPVARRYNQESRLERHGHRPAADVRASLTRQAA